MFSFPIQGLVMAIHVVPYRGGGLLLSGAAHFQDTRICGWKLTGEGVVLSLCRTNTQYYPS